MFDIIQILPIITLIISLAPIVIAIWFAFKFLKEARKRNRLLEMLISKLDEKDR